ncbi:molybdenum cofactor guanylyltransferase [Patulibacter americanus]|uniref:molybdenum cofactor guanylyltransferase n=1 Tax=Patulibacter americanus TaxID=588672 RepID=UPI0003B76B6D|nr:NTP transferase domain-containing protein [Patulibacter americanus]
MAAPRPPVPGTASAPDAAPPAAPDAVPPRAPAATPPAAVVAILAGGRSRRMGTPKAGVLLDGRPLLEHAVAAVRSAGLIPVVVAKDDSLLPRTDAERWGEPAEPRHPLAGVAAALGRAGVPVVVLPVDLPRVPPGLLAHLAARPEPLVVVEGAGRLHPLLGRFDPRHAPALAQAAAEGAPVVRTVRALGAVTVDGDVLAAFGDPAAYLVNVNRPEDLDSARDTAPPDSGAAGAAAPPG